MLNCTLHPPAKYGTLEGSMSAKTQRQQSAWKFDSAEEQDPVLQESQRLEISVEREAGWLPFLFSLLEG